MIDTVTVKNKTPLAHRNITPIKGRISVWHAMRGIWKNAKKDPIKELNKTRMGWDRKIV